MCVWVGGWVGGGAAQLMLAHVCHEDYHPVGKVRRQPLIYGHKKLCKRLNACPGGKVLRNG